MVLGRIVRVLDGPLAPIQCSACTDCMTKAGVHLIMLARDALSGETPSLAEMRALSNPYEQSTMYKFEQGGSVRQRKTLHGHGHFETQFYIFIRFDPLIKSYVLHLPRFSPDLP